MSTHKLTDGQLNKIFRIEGDLATVISLNEFGRVETEQMTTGEARKLYAFGKKLGWTEGFTRLQAYKRLTTDQQFDAYIAANYDLSSDNDPEAVLALEETFVGQGYLEVAA